MKDLKITKIHDLGMEIQFFVLRFGICIGGVGEKLRGCFCFLKMGFLSSL